MKLKCDESLSNLAFSCPTSGLLGDSKRVRVRAVPESGGQLADSLRGGAAAENIPPGNEGGHGNMWGLSERRAAARDGPRAGLEQQEARKLSREARLREIRGGDGVGGYHMDPAGGDGGVTPGRAGSGAAQHPEDQQHAVRGKLLEDIDSARRRTKRASVLVGRCTLTQS
jgi:hypothetical protein